MGLFNHKKDNDADATSNPFTGYADDTTTQSDNTNDASSSYLDGLNTDNSGTASSTTDDSATATNNAGDANNDEILDSLLSTLQDSTPASTDSVEPQSDLLKEDSTEVETPVVEPVATPEPVETPAPVVESEPVETPVETPKITVEEREPVEETKTKDETPEAKPERKSITVVENNVADRKNTAKNGEQRVAEFEDFLTWANDDTEVKTRDVQAIIDELEDRIQNIRDDLVKDTEGLSDEAKSIFEKNTDKNIELITDQITKERKTQTALDNRKHAFIAATTKALENYRRPIKADEIANVEARKGDTSENK